MHTFPHLDFGTKSLFQPTLLKGQKGQPLTFQWLHNKPKKCLIKPFHTKPINITALLCALFECKYNRNTKSPKLRKERLENLFTMYCLSKITY